MKLDRRRIGVLCLTLLTGAAVLRSQPRIEETYLFVGGQDDVNTYRIPSLICTKSGTVLAFAEGRFEKGDDGAPTHLVMKRSAGNNGPWTPSDQRSRKTNMTWLPMQILIPSTAGDAYMNPVPVIDRADGAIFVLVNRYSRPYQDLPAPILLMKSTDEGATWSSPVDITSGTGLRELGPGSGIQLQNGRLVVATYTSVIYSDDHGANWKSGGKLGGPENETGVVELANGSLMVNKRSTPNRWVMTSDDQGQTWNPATRDATLTDTELYGGCEGSFIRYTREEQGQGKNRLLFANPADLERRFKLTIRMSYDEGKTWPIAKTLNEGPGGYSSMTVFPDGSVGIIYESGDAHYGTRDSIALLKFARFNLEWLTDNRDHLRRID